MVTARTVECIGIQSKTTYDSYKQYETEVGGDPTTIYSLDK